MLVGGAGKCPADIAFIGEQPGVEELRQGEPFVGRTSRDFNQKLLPALSLSRHDVWLDNLHGQPAADPHARSKAEKEQDYALLETRLARVKPQLIVTIGAEATRYFLGKDADLDEVHGILWKDPKVEGRMIFPTAHIAAYTPDMQARVSYDFNCLKDVMYGEATEPRALFGDAFPEPTYIEVTDPKWLRCVLTGLSRVYIDTEGHPDRVWSLQFAAQPGTAYLVRMENRPCLQAFMRWLLAERPRVVFHGSLHDLGIMRAILQACDLPVEALYQIRFDDTQIMAYLLQAEPVGLKPNCVRHCGMRMQDYNDVLGDAQIRLSQDYLIKIFDVEQARYRQRQVEARDETNRTPLLGKDGKPKRDKQGHVKFHKTSVLPALPRTDLHKAAERVLRSARPFQLWQDQNEDIKVAAYETEVGR